MNSFISVEEAVSGYELDDLIFSASSISGSSVHSVCPDNKSGCSANSKDGFEFDHFPSRRSTISLKGLSTPDYIDRWLCMNQSHLISDSEVDNLLSGQNYHWMFTSESESEFDGFSDASGSSFEGFHNGVIKNSLSPFSKLFKSGICKRSSTPKRRLSRRLLSHSSVLKSFECSEEFLQAQVESKGRQNYSESTFHSLPLPDVPVVSKEMEKTGGDKGREAEENVKDYQSNSRVGRTLRAVRTRSYSGCTRSKASQEKLKEIKLEYNETPSISVEDTDVLFEGFCGDQSLQHPLLKYARTDSLRFETQKFKSRIEHCATDTIGSPPGDYSDYIGMFCNNVGCTISWLESGASMEYPVCVTNGIVYEFNEFAKKIAWEPFYVARWILRLRGYDTIETSNDDLKKIHLLLKRRKALSVTLAGRNGLKQKMNSFDSGEFSLPSAEKLDNLKDSLIEENIEKIEEPPDNLNNLPIHQVNESLLGRTQLPVDVKDELEDKFNEVNNTRKEKEDLRSSTESKCSDKSCRYEKSVGTESSGKESEHGELLINEDVSEKSIGENDQIKNADIKENLNARPIFDNSDELIGNHCRAQGITPGFLNLSTPLSEEKMITNGIVYELYNFYRKKGATLTSLVHTLYELKSVPFTRISIISSMAKIHELIKVLWREKFLENPDMPYEEFVLPSLKHISNPDSTEEQDDELLPYDEQKATGTINKSSQLSGVEDKYIKASDSHCSKLSDSVKESSSPIRDNESTTSLQVPPENDLEDISAQNKDKETIDSISIQSQGMENENVQAEDSKSDSEKMDQGEIVVGESTSLNNVIDKDMECEKEMETNVLAAKGMLPIIKPCYEHEKITEKDFNLKETTGSIGEITKGDIVFLYTRWLKKKIDQRTSVFVTDLSNDLQNLIKERNVVSIRIPVGTLMSSSVKLFEEFREISKVDIGKARDYLLGDWLSEVQSTFKSKPMQRSSVDCAPSNDAGNNSNSIASLPTMVQSSQQVIGNGTSIVKNNRSNSSETQSTDTTDAPEESEVYLDRVDESLNENKLLKNSEKRNESLKHSGDSSMPEHNSLKKVSNTKSLSIAEVEKSPSVSGAENQHTVDKIVGYRIVKVGDTSVTEYRVRWVGSSTYDDTWVDENELKHPDILHQFWNALNKQRALKGLTEDGRKPRMEPFSNSQENVKSDASIPPFLGNCKNSSYFFSHFISKLKCDLIDYKLESDEESTRRIKVTKGDVLNIYDRWRANNQGKYVTSEIYRLSLKLLKDEVKQLIEEKKVRNFNSSCLIDCCYRMSLMRAKCNNQKVVEEYINGDFIELMKSSQRHLDVIRKENEEKSLPYRKEKTSVNIEKETKTESNDLISKLDSLEKEMFVLSNVLRNNNSSVIQKVINSFTTGSEKKIEKACDINALKRQNESTFEELNGYGLSSQALEDIIEMAF